MNKSCEKKTTAHSQNILHVDVLYNIKRKKYKTVCAELAFTKLPSTEWSWFCIYRTYNSFSLFAMQLDYCNIQRVFDQK
jgi:hypothetical protein